MEQVYQNRVFLKKIYTVYFVRCLDYVLLYAYADVVVLVPCKQCKCSKKNIYIYIYI